MTKAQDKPSSSAHLNKKTWADIRPHTNSIANQMFVFTADRNYILARTAFFNELDLDFYWLSLHALEKYFKAILLMNDAKTARFGHDLKKLYDATLKLDSRITFGSFVDPKIPDLYWRNETVEKYLGRLNKYGAAANRYSTYGHSLNEDDLFRVDQLVWSVRRYCRQFSYERKRPNGSIFRIDELDLLQHDQSYWALGSLNPIEKLLAAQENNPTRQAFLLLNTPFAPNAKHALISWRSSFTNPPLADWFRLLQASKASPETHKTAEAVLKWALEHIKFNKGDEDEIKAALKKYADSSPPHK